MEGPASTPNGATTTGPTSFSDASLTWSDASSASDPTPDPTAAADTPASATATPAPDPTDDGSTPAAGEPPKERWNDILANARQKAVAEWEQQYGWAKQVDPQEFQQVQRLARMFSANPIDALQQLMAEIQQNPQYAAELRSLQGRALAQLRQQQQTPSGPDLNPIQVQMEDGKTVGLYTAEQIAALKDQWLSAVEQKFQPVTQTIEQLQAEKAAIAKQQEITHFVTTTYQDVTTWPGMDDKANQAKVADALARMPLQSDDPREVSLALNAAWRQVVLPTLTQKTAQQAETKLLDNLQRKAAASTGVNPGSAAASTPRKITKFSDLGPEAWR